ncbi:unnamed protein product [Phytomonas sp. EM1]|nr:unnamed protein product [Phytomonas sp. EM1]|eukprot:CCW64694.1 unnamed protein product [Phytomonas sp. isolate EM1]
MNTTLSNFNSSIQSSQGNVSSLAKAINVSKILKGKATQPNLYEEVSNRLNNLEYSISCIYAEIANAIKNADITQRLHDDTEKIRKYTSYVTKGIAELDTIPQRLFNVSYATGQQMDMNQLKSFQANIKDSYDKVNLTFPGIYKGLDISTEKIKELAQLANAYGKVNAEVNETKSLINKIKQNVLTLHVGIQGIATDILKLAKAGTPTKSWTQTW